MPASIRLMTSNLLAGQADPAAYRELLEFTNPDIVVTQELGHDQAEVLATHFPHHRLVPTDEFDGRGIATRLDAELADIPIPERDGTSASFEVDGEEWNLAGIHLLNPINFPQWRSVKGRTAQLDSIEQWGKSRTASRVVVTGDFNASPKWPAYKRMHRDWTDVVAEHATGRRPDRTWAWRPGWPRMLRIDHVFGHGVIATGAEVLRLAGSDHHALVVDLVPIP